MRFAFVPFAYYSHFLSFCVVTISEQTDYIFGCLLHLRVAQNRINNWEITIWIFTTEIGWKQPLVSSNPLHKTYSCCYKKHWLTSRFFCFVWGFCCFGFWVFFRKLFAVNYLQAWISKKFCDYGIIEVVLEFIGSFWTKESKPSL